MTEPVLTPGDRQTAVWQKLAKYLEAQLAVMRARNDKHATEQGTIRIRERIATLKDLLSLGTDKPRVPSEDEIFKD